VILAEQSKGHLTLLRDEDGDGKADWIQRHAEGFNGPYGLAWRDGAVLVADQDGIWEVPHRLGALRPGAGGQNTLAADVPAEQRKPTTALVGERMITKKGVFGIVQGHANRHLATCGSRLRTASHRGIIRTSRLASGFPGRIAQRSGADRQLSPS
jgi:hypothetical protein